MCAELEAQRSVVLDRVMDFIADAIPDKSKKVTPEANIFDDLGIDSLGLVFIFVNLKDEYQVQEPEDEEAWGGLSTANDFADYVLGYGDRAPAAPRPPRATEVSRLVPSELLPYGKEFLFIDRVLFCTDKRIVTATDWSRRRRILKAHFRGGPAIVPGALLLEQTAQTAALLHRLIRPSAETPRLVRSSCTYLAPVVGGKATETEVKLGKRRGFIVDLRGSVSVERTKVAQFKLTVSLGSARHGR